MVNQKRFKNYIIYAIGEIILVVIGILIAVSINNRNENQKLEDDTVKIAKQIEAKLISDLQLIDNVKKYIENEELKYDRYLKKNKTKDERLKVVLEAPFLVTLGTQLLPINEISASKLEKTSFNNSDLAYKLVEIEQDYKAFVSGLKTMDDYLTKELISNLNHIKENYDWYEKLIIPNSNFTTDEYKYFGSTDYRNRVVHMKFLYANGYLGTVEEIETSLKKRLEELQTLLPQSK